MTRYESSGRGYGRPDDRRSNRRPAQGGYSGSRPSGSGRGAIAGSRHGERGGRATLPGNDARSVRGARPGHSSGRPLGPRAQEASRGRDRLGVSARRPLAYGGSPDRGQGPHGGSGARGGYQLDADRRRPGRAGGGLGIDLGFELPGISTIVGALVVVVIAASAIFAWSNRSVDIKINGSNASVKVGSTLEDIISSKRLAVTAGDLISVGGNVIRQGQGYAYSATVNGEEISPDKAGDYRAASGDDLSISDGADKCEDYEVTTVEEQPKLEMGGDAWGNITYISQWPKVGKREVRTGKVSGETADGDVIQETQNCVVTVHQISPDDKSRKLIALTFDDGPADPYTEKYISILNQYGIHATFFNLGENIKEYPELCKKIVESGNELMSHTQQHQQLTALDAASLQSEFSTAFEQINATAGIQTTSFRPPYGDFKETTWLKSGGLASLSVLWNLDSEDWRRAGADSIVSKSTTGAFSGAIILMHDGGGDRSQDVEALPRIIETLQSEGYEFVTVGELMRSDSSIPSDIANGYATMPEDSVWPTEIAS